jgi:hypothetical protein
MLPPFSLHPEDGDCKVFRNDGILPHHYTQSQPRRPHFTLKMETERSSETLVSYHITTRCNNSDDCDLDLHGRENLSLIFSPSLYPYAKVNAKWGQDSSRFSFPKLLNGFRKSVYVSYRANVILVHIGSL